MSSKDYIKDIQMFINEAYSDNEPLKDNQIKSKKIFNNYCNKIKQDLERLERVENAIQEAQLKHFSFDDHPCYIRGYDKAIEDISEVLSNE